jgi:hypothetical protein
VEIKIGFGDFTMIPMWLSIRPGQHLWCLPGSKTWFQWVARSFEVLQVPQKNSCMSRNLRNLKIKYVIIQKGMDIKLSKNY